MNSTFQTVEAVRLNELAKMFRELNDMSAKALAKISQIRGRLTAPPANGFRPLNPVSGIAVIQMLTARQYDVTVEQLKSRRRNAHLVWPRHVSMWLCRELLDVTLQDLARHYDKSHYSRICHAVVAVRTQLELNTREAQQVRQLKAAVMAELNLGKN